MAMLLLMREGVTARQIIPVDGGQVSVAADGVPLEALLRRFQELVNLRVSLQPAVRERPVTVHLEPSPIVSALHQVLQAAGVDFVLTDDTPREPMRLAVGEWRGSSLPRSDVPAVVHSRVDPPAGQAVPDVRAPNEEPERSEPDTLPGAEASPPPGPVIPAAVNPGERLVQLLAPRRQPKQPRGALIVLPFPGLDGQPLTVPHYPPPSGIARVPFPDANGNPIEFVVPALNPEVFTLPFLGLDGQPFTVRRTPTSTAARPSGGR